MHNAISLHSPDGTYSIPLVSIAIEGTQHNLMADITVEQTFKNVEPRSIEAVYTFPLPHNAVLMGLHVILGERTLQGIVEAASEADERYETAISEGDGVATPYLPSYKITSCASLFQQPSHLVMETPIKLVSHHIRYRKPI